ncbi:hypothetical protein [Leptolyngbya sp. FACHB-17]|uniref:hypothetical protein n=1 Tax=Leptolyngbya sp. FACHB-17 TaxID=2692803 RepID=UPI001680E5B3|nr:hypothetical protein [Leptolyngbya sp. FACHB-17]MBD2079800.1 hypothetical protein [Leptolyngbya sp. FACHB-17]
MNSIAVLNDAFSISRGSFAIFAGSFSIFVSLFAIFAGGANRKRSKSTTQSTSETVASASIEKNGSKLSNDKALSVN